MNKQEWFAASRAISEKRQPEIDKFVEENGESLYIRILTELIELAGSTTEIHFNERTSTLLIKLDREKFPSLEVYSELDRLSHLWLHMPPFLREIHIDRLFLYLPDAEQPPYEKLDLMFAYEDEGDDDWNKEVLRGYEMTEVLPDGTHAKR